MADRLKVVVTDYIEDDLKWETEELAKAGLDFEAMQLKFLPEEQVAARIADADIIVVNMVKMTESLISKLKRCRLIIRHGVGYDNVDVAACTRRRIPFAYQPAYCREDVAEHAIALIYACGRKVVWSRKTLDESSASAKWDFSKLFPIHRIEGKILGVIGTGRIGGLVVSKLKSSGLRIVGCDPYLTDVGRKRLTIDYVDLDTLLKTSDFVTVHTPLNDETRHMINARTLALMKPTAYLINTSRGPMVDELALADALRRRQIAGAAIDVFEREPPDPSHPFFGLDNIILTPHIGWASVEAGMTIRKDILDDILAAAQGKPARYVVNKEALAAS